MKKIGLVPRLIIAITLGIVLGLVLPSPVIRIFVTFSSLFSKYLSFVIPFMIIGFVVTGISDLRQGAGKLLGITTLIAYVSTIVAGSLSYLMATNIFPKILNFASFAAIEHPEKNLLTAYFEIPLAPMFDVTSAIVFAFIMGLSISWLRNNGEGQTTYNLFREFSKIITKLLSTSVIPLLPVYIFGTFMNMTYSGQMFTTLSIFLKVFICVIILHILYISALFVFAGGLSGKNPFTCMKNQIPGYFTALGTQSSAATIPINLECAKRNGTSPEIREFVVPLCATIHLAGSIITITSCVVTVLMMNNMAYDVTKVFPFILVLGVAMVAAPGAPGGAIMSALPFLGMVGIAANSPLASLLIALYITQDSFGTAANVSGDNAIAIVVDWIYHKFIKNKNYMIEKMKNLRYN
ncbi:dicarboxylate/amino acid:cation symporter [Leptotrichia hofstadii]|uniref:Transporter, dicarboxylate/amino acid:cation Na+/H+ symporter family protein n=1 Tax=Leptotrichia hofstadii F0254 TaxID=634994 RepID=C9MY21_9FUSO|nr:dicarboxylate/amino acid:cation symporter [Leptotrichia hofstadii]EEX74401.1 transporter, dicarboxylate/amino acid:cation Na+/H+ symporter family protein [Leptotrichia hofstadii F0254]